MNNITFTTLKVCKSEEFLLVFGPNIFYMEEQLIHIFYISRGTRYYEKVYRPQDFAIGDFSIDTAEAAF